jgi:hypothetical protein
MLAALTRAVEWVWIAGNHDGDTDAAAGGTQAGELAIGAIVLRHQARPGETRPELSGHFHPRLRVTVRERSIRRSCAVVASAGDGGRMILPAFGALTGGMDAADPAIVAALQPAGRIDAVLAAGGKLVHYPLWRA